ncbi:MAG: presenilin family intramembrane aspartyl protease [Candidatus Woesearchaeota archaeon]|jgi:presenilin-like A22 family membrane protease|nr:presenilin family intramembrane aspartyl protease [Candidatus Woesearchaeota archaeon]MDP7198795.1 presenilin family intramembrane aspartyl protease [Candidatus Woesearchaeota archaeon]MDP7467205.1 presenilin family intramembrane aspartyl protease [Candidatus Woesearchaeota archaeon]MDP7647460.1 presenilin family intramembrane aspartyl protease [Candidatus Woesearchaeota archaeon]
MKHPLGPTTSLVVLFILAQVVGLFITQAYIPVEAGVVVIKDLPTVAGMEIERPDVPPQQGLWIVVGAIVVGTVLMLGIVWMGAGWLWKLWYFMSVLVLLNIALASVLEPTPSLVFALILAFLKTYKKSSIVHNFTEILVYGGLAAIFVPLLKEPWIMLVLLGLISVYDVIAVRKTQHMVKMAKFQMEHKTFGGIMLQYGKEGKPGKIPKNTKPVGGTAILGGGDIGFPLLFLGTLLYTRGMTASFIALPFVVASLVYLLWQSKKDKFYPAMPFLTVGCLAGYAIVLLV